MVCGCTRGATGKKTLGVNITPNGTMVVGNDLSIPGHPDCFVVGDVAHVLGPGGRPLPDLASVALRQGCYVGNIIAARLARRAATALAPEWTFCRFKTVDDLLNPPVRDEPRQGDQRIEHSGDPRLDEDK
jgi:NADH dehydrogenase